jgi:2-amino-4-hydroxy-6-hydroxymethyldihydropteridine diphosphokinase
MESVDVYVGMGGNIGNSQAYLQMAMEKIRELPFVSHFRTSKIYRTTPVSTIPQADYLNAVCTFQSNCSIDFLFTHLQKIECALGKEKKSKEEPRVIDLDILLVGKLVIDREDLQIPHPRFLERLFVLKPLRDLAEMIWIPDVSSSLGVKQLNLTTYLADFPNKFRESVIPIEEGVK